MNKDEILKCLRSTVELRSDALKWMQENSSAIHQLKVYVLSQGGNEEDARELWQMTLVGFLKTILKNRDLIIHNSLDDYLFGIGKNLYLTQKRRLSKVDSFNIEEAFESSFEDQMLLSERKKRILLIIESTIGIQCQKVLWMWAGKYTMEEIANEIGLKNSGMAKKIKYECIKKMMKVAEENPDLKNLFF